MLSFSLIRNTEPRNFLGPKVLLRLLGMMKPSVSPLFPGDLTKSLLPPLHHIEQCVDVSQICTILPMGHHKAVPIDREADLGAIFCGFSLLSFLDGHHMRLIKAIELTSSMMARKTLGVLVNKALGEFFEFA